MRAIIQPFSEQTLGDTLKAALIEQSPTAWHSFQAAVAFVKRSGVQHIEQELQEFLEQGGYVRLIIGIDQYGTSIEGLTDLLTVIGDKGEVWINHDSNNYITFHPKVYLFERSEAALLIIGSGNLTQGGLYTNDEASLVYEFDLANQEDQLLLKELKDVFERWCDNSLASVKRLDEHFLEELIQADYIRPEIGSDTEDEAEVEASSQQEMTSPPVKTTVKKILFGRGIRRKRPTKQRDKIQAKKGVEDATVENEYPQGFVMTLMRTDVGSGQTTPGTSRRSPEIFIPLTARNMYPEFWGWPDIFSEDATKRGKFDRPGVLMRIGGEFDRP